MVGTPQPGDGLTSHPLRPLNGVDQTGVGRLNRVQGLVDERQGKRRRRENTDIVVRLTSVGGLGRHRNRHLPGDFPDIGQDGAGPGSFGQGRLDMTPQPAQRSTSQIPPELGQTLVVDHIRWPPPQHGQGDHRGKPPRQFRTVPPLRPHHQASRTGLLGPGAERLLHDSTCFTVESRVVEKPPYVSHLPRGHLRK